MDENRTETLAALRNALGLERLLGRLREPARPASPMPTRRRRGAPRAPKPTHAAA